MREKIDIFGKECWEYFKGNEVNEIIERKDGFIHISPGPKLYFSDYKNWSKREKKAMKFVKGRVIDIGCGVGRHSVYLQSRGFEIMGADNSPLAIKICKLRGLRKARVMDMEDISKLRLNSFDTVILLGNNFGLLESFDRAKNLLKQLHKITPSNGIIITESFNHYDMRGGFHTKYRKMNIGIGRMPGQWRIRIRFDKFIGPWYDYLIVSKNEMNDILKDTGWKVQKFIDSDSSSYIAIIKKIYTFENKNQKDILKNFAKGYKSMNKIKKAENPNSKK